MQPLTDSQSENFASGLVMQSRPSVQPLNRLIGLETEYAVRFRDADTIGEGFTHRQIFRGAIRALKSRLPLAPADYSQVSKEGFFTANGSAVWFERSRFAGDTGLIEGSTPECRGPLQLLTHQRAMDQLFGESVVQGSPLSDTALLKNCRDPNGKSYGAQENYEVEFARGWSMAAWKALVYILMPITLLGMVFFLIFIGLLGLFNTFVVVPIYSAWNKKHVMSDPELRKRLIGPAWFSGGERDAPYPLWMEPFIMMVMRLVALPAAVGVCSFLPLLTYRRTQRKLTPFLISRIALAGAGSVDAKGRFLLAEKADSRNRQYFTILVDFDQPIFSPNNLLKPMLTLGLFPKRSRGIFRPRQRLQIGIGDSNMCEEAEYLKIGTTLLVIDAIEAGYLKKVPQMWSPMSALHRWNRNPELDVSVRTSLGRMKILDVQKHYLAGVKRYLTDCHDVPEEAWHLLSLWEDVLDRLDNDQDSLFGRLDWVTKRQLVQQPENHGNKAAIKKVDLKYHELSEDGYFSKLEKAGLTSRVVDEVAMERATRLPPPINPAAARCNYIREFVGSVEWVSWDTVQLGPKFDNRLVLLEDEADREVSGSNH